VIEIKKEPQRVEDILRAYLPFYAAAT
jgi:hypothetical protein